MHELCFFQMEQYYYILPPIELVERTIHVCNIYDEALCGKVNIWTLNYCRKELHLKYCKGPRSTSAWTIVLYI